MGGALLGWRTVCAVELDAYCRDVLLMRQRDGVLPRFPIWDDVRSFDGKPWRGHVDVISGGFPCQDISSAGKRAGITGARSGLWGEFARIIGEVGPRYVFVENSPDLATRGLGTVLGDLAALGYDAQWDVFGAHHVGAPHKRDRMWIVASHPDRRGERVQPFDAEVGGPPAAARADGNPDRERQRCEKHQPPQCAGDPYANGASHPEGIGRGARECRAGFSDVPTETAISASPDEREPIVDRWWECDRFAGVDDGASHQMDRVRATGNGQVPAVVRLAWEILAGGEP